MKTFTRDIRFRWTILKKRISGTIFGNGEAAFGLSLERSTSFPTSRSLSGSPVAKPVHQQRYQQARLRRILVASHATKMSHGAQQVMRAGIRPHFAGSHSRVEQPLQGGFEMPVEIGR